MVFNSSLRGLTLPTKTSFIDWSSSFKASSLNLLKPCRFIPKTLTLFIIFTLKMRVYILNIFFYIYLIGINKEPKEKGGS